jgi:dipeptidyl-peptidase-4
LHARIVKPPDFGGSKRRPVILRVYGGAGVPIVQDDWDRGFLYDRCSPSRVTSWSPVDPRVATAASKKIEDAVLRNLWSDAALNDLIDAVRWLEGAAVGGSRAVRDLGAHRAAARSPLVAMTRSAEFAAGRLRRAGDRLALLRQQGDRGVHEDAGGEPRRDTSAPRSCPRAKDLPRAGLLPRSSARTTTTCHPQNEWAFADALVEAGKPFDMMVYPGRKHGIDDRAARRHLMETMVEFWGRWLGGQS